MEDVSSTKNKVDLIQQAIQQLIESKPPHLHHNNEYDNQDHHHHLLTKLLSQILVYVYLGLYAVSLVRREKSENINHVLALSDVCATHRLRSFLYGGMVAQFDDLMSGLPQNSGFLNGVGSQTRSPECFIYELEALKADGVLDPPEPVAESKEVSSCKSAETETKGEDETETSKSTIVSESEDVVKQLKKLEQQNRVTHWLLSALILLTVAWQLSEVSLLLKMKEGVTHPFKSIGNMFKDVLKRPRPNEQEQSKLPLVELPDLVMNDEHK